MCRRYFQIVFLGFLLLITACSKTTQPELTFCSWGGSYQEAQSKSYLQPFAKEFGIKVNETSYSGEFAKLKGMVETGNVTWDIVSVTQSIFSRGVKEGLFEPLDFSIIDTTNMMPGTVSKYGIAHLLFSTILAYNADSYVNSKVPSNWKEFWDVKHFKGKRAIRDTPIGNLEFALLAAGKPIDSLYPIDVDKAFKKLDEIKPDIRVWWAQGQQPPQLLSTHDVDLSTAFNGRIWKARKDGQKLNIIWDEGMLEPEYFVVLKGSKNRISSFKLINFALQAPQQTEFVKTMGYGPTNKLVLQNIPDPLRLELPSSDSNIKNQFMINGNWWADNEERVLELWNKWKLGK